MNSEWGKDNAQVRVANGKPDLVIIAFGMNDGSAKVTPTTFAANIKAIMATVRLAQPKAEFILVAPMLPNPEAAEFIGRQNEYGPVLKAMMGPGVAFVDMTTVHAALLKGKKYRDMTGNNVNHPNDFLIRWYAQMTAGLLVSD
jgi:lysophospholipase L1-like esterase